MNLASRTMMLLGAATLAVFPGSAVASCTAGADNIAGIGEPGFRR